MSQASLPLAAPVARRPAKLCSDAQLAQRGAQGDERAFTEIFERHHQAVYRYCRSILGNGEDAADALQSTMAAVLRGLDGETRRIALKPWLFRIAHNEALDILRRRRPQSELDETQPCPRSGVETEVLQSEQLRQMVADVAALPDRQRSALVMRELNDLEYSEIAAVFGVAEGAARQAVHEARTMLGELAAGRVIPCADIRELISARDGRLMRGRKVRSHLRSCEACDGFHAAIGNRRAGLAAAAPPLSAPLAASILSGLLGGGSAGGAAGTLTAAGVGVTAAGSAAPAANTAGVAALAAKAVSSAGIVTKSVAALGAAATIAGGSVAIERQVGSSKPSPAVQGADPSSGGSRAGQGAGNGGAVDATSGTPSGAGGSQAGAGKTSPAAGAPEATSQSADGDGAHGSPGEAAGSDGGGLTGAIGDLADDAPAAAGGDRSPAGEATVDTGSAQQALKPHTGAVEGVLSDPGAAAGSAVPSVTLPGTPATPPVTAPDLTDPGSLTGGVTSRLPDVRLP